MPIRQEVIIHPVASFAHSRSSFCLRLLRTPLWALIISAGLGLGSTNRAIAEETPAPQTQTGASPAGQAPAGQTPAGQTPADQAPPSQAPADKGPTTPLKAPVSLYNLLQEKSIVFPDIALNTERLSSGQKFQLFVDNSISVHTITYSMLGAGIGQAEDSPTGFGQGWDGYAKRFGSSMGRQASSEFFGTFVLASALHEDPRFYAEINPTFFHAVKYSAQRVFITRNDDGRDVINVSGLLGPAMAEGLANVYWPDQNRTVGDTLLRYGIDLATKAGGNMLREYWPVFYGKIHHAPRPSSGHN